MKRTGMSAMARKAVLVPSCIAVLSSKWSRFVLRLGFPPLLLPTLARDRTLASVAPTYFYRDGLEPMNTRFEAIVLRIFVGGDDQGFADFGGR